MLPTNHQEQRRLRCLIAGLNLAILAVTGVGCDRPPNDTSTARGAQVRSSPTAGLGEPHSAPLELAAAKLHATPDKVELSKGQVLSLPLTRRDIVTRYKAYVSTAKEQTLDIAVDADGNELNLDSILASETAAWQAKYGKKSAILYDRIQSAQAGQLLQVSAWLHIPDADIVTTITPPAGDGISKSARLSPQAADSLRRTAVSAYERSTMNVKSRFLKKLRKFDPAAMDVGAEPVFVATLSAEAISAIEQDDDVVSMDISEDRPALQLGNASLSLGYASVHSSPINITGSGVQVGMVEPSAPLPAANLMPDLSGFTEPNPGTGCADDENHMERVASVIKSSQYYYQGVAPGSSLYLAGKCNSSTSDLQTENTNAKNWGALAINNS
jgi:hypothetical protein